MSAESAVNNGVTTGLKGVGDAVGVSDLKWFIAIVNNNCEKAVGQKLEEKGYENYVPLQSEMKIWKNGRKAIVDRVVIPSIVFIHCSENMRREVVSLPYINRFMTNKAGSPTGFRNPLAVVPDDQIERLKFMVGNSDSPVTFSSASFRTGDVIRVVRGRLAGLEGEIQYVDEKHSELIVRLDFLGNARLTIETINVEPITY